MKTKINLIPVCLLGAALLALPFVGQTQFIYTTNNGAIHLAQDTSPGGDVVIPNTVGILPIAKIFPFKPIIH